MKNEKKDNQALDRRSFMKRAWAWLGVVAGIEFSAVAFNLFSPGMGRNQPENPNNIKTVGFVDQIEPGTVIPVKSGQFFLVCFEDGGMLALSLTCTHLGCPVNWNNTKQQFICPCHSSAFDMEGNVLKSPATRALDMYKINIVQGLVQVDTGIKIKRKGFLKSDLVYA